MCKPNGRYLEEFMHYFCDFFRSPLRKRQITDSQQTKKEANPLKLKKKGLFFLFVFLNKLEKEVF